MRVMVLIGAVALFGAIGVPSALGDEQPRFADAADPEGLADIIADLGYRAKLETDSVGDPLIRSTISGTQFAIIFHRCDERTHDGCQLVLFSAGYDLESGVDAQAINEWNATRLVGRAYRDDVNDPWIDMPVVLKNGVTRENFEAVFKSWEITLGDFEDHIGL